MSDPFEHLFEATETDTILSDEYVSKAVNLKIIDAPRFAKLVAHIKGIRIQGGYGLFSEKLKKTERELKKQQRLEAAKQVDDDGFLRNDKGGIITCAPNIVNAVGLKGFDVRWDSFARKVMLFPIGSNSNEDGVYMQNSVASDLRIRLDHDFGLRNVPKDLFMATMEELARRNSYHPVLDELNSYEWDGTPRIDTWLIDHLKIDDTPFHRAIGRIWLIAAIRRLLEPGIKFDECLLICGAQGLQKSLLFSTMAIKEDWFTESVSLTDDDKKVMEQTQGKWIIEISELKGGRKADIEAQRSQLSRVLDRARLAYAMTTEEVLRQFVWGGTSNALRPLFDLEGNRRYWPVLAETLIDADALIAVRSQLWAEAMVYAKKRESIRLPKELWDDARSIQKNMTRENFIEERLRSYIPDDMDGVLSSEELWAIAGVGVTQRAGQADQFGAALKNMGFVRTRRKYKGQKVACYVRSSNGSDAPELHVQRNGLDGTIKGVEPYVSIEDHRDKAVDIEDENW